LIDRPSFARASSPSRASLGARVARGPHRDRARRASPASKRVAPRAVRELSSKHDDRVAMCRRDRVPRAAHRDATARARRRARSRSRK